MYIAHEPREGRNEYLFRGGSAGEPWSGSVARFVQTEAVITEKKEQRARRQ